MLAKIRGGWESLRRWIGENIIGEEDSTTPEERRFRDYALVGAGAGVVAGGVWGALGGFRSQAADSIREEWPARKILEPHLQGYSESVVADVHHHCETHDHGDYSHEHCTDHVHGYWHYFSPRVGYTQVGEYREPQFRHTHSWEPLGGAVVGALVGGLSGLGIGVAAAALHRAIEKAPPPPPRLDQAERRRLADFAGGAAVTGTTLGAGLGALVGMRAGQAELSNQEIHRRFWLAPVMQDKYLGDIPRDHYDWFWPYHDDWSRGRDPVYRLAPVYNADGSVRMEQVSREFRTGRYGPVAGGILGGLIGAGSGLAAGVAAGVAARLLAERRAARQGTAGEAPGRENPGQA